MAAQRNRSVASYNTAKALAQENTALRNEVNILKEQLALLQ